MLNTPVEIYREFVMTAIETLTKPTKAPLATLAKESPNEESSISFEEFLKGISQNKSSKNSQNTLALLEEKQEISPNEKTDLQDKLLTLLKQKPENNSKKEPQTSQKQTLESLLKNPDTLPASEFELNPKLTQQLSGEDLKALIQKARDYLKEQINAEQQLQNVKSEKLPNSLKSLINIADTLKIDLEKITYSSIDDEQALSMELDKETLLKLKENRELSKVSTRITIEEKVQTSKDSTQVATIKTETKVVDNIPLFTKKSTITTQEIVSAKELAKQKTKKNTQNRQDSLQMLLSQSTKETKETGQEPRTLLLNAFNKTAPEEKTPASIQNDEKESSSKQKGLEELLRSPQNNTHDAKVSTPKNDSLDVKIHEAKQMMKYLSQDIKQAIEDYKPPFSRLKVKLNPQKLGEVDLTVVQRGKNVHVNLSSNNAALNILSNNLNELKVQLNNSGIQNASFSFNQNSQQQNDEQKRRHAALEYELNENGDDQEGVTHSLEIIIPRYI